MCGVVGEAGGRGADKGQIKYKITTGKELTCEADEWGPVKGKVDVMAMCDRQDFPPESCYPKIRTSVTAAFPPHPRRMQSTQVSK